FACRKPWRVVDSGELVSKAWVTAEFQGSIDAPESLAHWPADYRIKLTVSLEVNQLSFVARIDNPDSKPLPFGLGYHPYLAIAAPGECMVTSAARAAWELEDNIPTGQIVAPKTDLRTPARLEDLQLDDVYTDFGKPSEMYQQGRVEWPGVGVVEVLASSGFREMVAFTPPHRRAVCLEPYTCTTDAINLQARGIDAGLCVLPPGVLVPETVRYRFAPRAGG